MVKHLVDGFKYYIYILQYVDLYYQYMFFFFKYLQIIHTLPSISGGSELQSSRQCETTHQGGIDGAIAAVSPSRRSSDLPVLLDIQYCSTVPTLRQNHFGLTTMHKYE